MTTTADIHAFFLFIFGTAPADLYTTINVFDGSSKVFATPRAFLLAPDELERMAIWAMAHRHEGQHLYFRPSALISPPLDHGRGKEKDTVGSSVLYCDLDIYKVGVERSAAVTQLLAGSSVPPPSCIIYSGGGLQAYWRLHEFQSTIAALKGRNRFLASQLRALGADNVIDYARVLRIPGTLNYKHTPPTEALILHLDTHCLYTMEDITYIPPLYEQAKKATAEDHAAQEATLPETFLEDMKKRDKKLHGLIFSKETAEQYHVPHTEGGAIDHSRNDYHIAVALLRLNYSEEQVYAVLTHTDWLSGAKYRETGREDYVRRTISKARAQSTPDTAQFFDGTRFVPEVMVEVLLQQGAHFLRVGSDLWYYDGGCYYPGGKDYVRHEVLLQLGKHWKSIHGEEVVKYITSRLFSEIEDVLHEPQPPARAPLAECELNIRSGVLNLETYQLRVHDPADFSMVQLPIHVTTSQFSPLHLRVRTPIELFLEQVLPADAMQAWWEWVGYHFLRDCRYRKALMLIGEPMTGKSTLLGVLERFLGLENCCSVALQDLCDDRFSSYGLIGKMANIFHDLDMTELKKPGNLKIFVSGERLAAEKKFEQKVEVYLFAKHSYSANFFLPVRDPDEAFISRFIVMRTPYQFAEGKGERNSANVRLINELATPDTMEHMLHMALHGLKRLCDHDQFTLGESMARAHDEFQASIDSVFGFIKAQVTIDAHGFSPKDHLYNTFRRWCLVQGNTGASAMSGKKFFMRLKSYFLKYGIQEARRTINGVQEYGYAGVTVQNVIREDTRPGHLIMVK